MVFKRWFRKSELELPAHELYRSAVAQARAPVFYVELGVADTLDGRFDMIVLHVFLILRRFKEEGEEARALAQKLFDILFDDMDQSLREIGVGDFSISKKVKAMASAFYGRVGAYDEALDAEDEASLRAALERNVYAERPVAPGAAAALGAYVRSAEAHLETQSFAALSDGVVSFPPPPSGAIPAGGSQPRKAVHDEG